MQTTLAGPGSGPIREAPRRRSSAETKRRRLHAFLYVILTTYFAISMLTDDVYRREFLDELTTEMSSSFKTRAKYLALRAGSRP